MIHISKSCSGPHRIYQTLICRPSPGKILYPCLVIVTLSNYICSIRCSLHFIRSELDPIILLSHQLFCRVIKYLFNPRIFFVFILGEFLPGYLKSSSFKYPDFFWNLRRFLENICEFICEWKNDRNKQLSVELNDT